MKFIIALILIFSSHFIFSQTFTESIYFYKTVQYDYDIKRNVSQPLNYNSYIMMDLKDGKGKVILYSAGKKNIFYVEYCEVFSNSIKFYYSTGTTSSLFWNKENYYTSFTLDDPRNNTAIVFYEQ